MNSFLDTCLVELSIFERIGLSIFIVSKFRVVRRKFFIERYPVSSLSSLEKINLKILIFKSL